MIFKDKVSRILNHERYREYLNKIEVFEKEREFCKHDIQHFIDTARISYILCLEKNLNISKDVFYAVGLLHDIGRWMQYESGIPHNEASVSLSEEILKDCDFTEEEISEIIKAILNHRKEDIETLNLSSIFYKADKLSRNCFYCSCTENCNWKKDRQNLTLKY